MIHVVAASHPLRVAEHADMYVPEGLTLLEMLEQAQPDPVLRRHAVIQIGEHIVPRSNWRLVRPRGGANVYIKVRPSGGGGSKNPLRTILTLAVMAAAFAFGGPLGSAIAGQIGLGTGLATSLAGGLIAPTGELLVSATPPEPRR